MKSLAGILVQCILAVSLAGCGLSPAPPTPRPTTAATPAPCTGPAITIGEISDDPEDVIGPTQPFASYLAGQLSDFGIVCGNAEVANNVPQMIDFINTGKVDVYFDSIFPATLVGDATGAIPILRRWKNCDPDYYSVIFTTADSGIKSIYDLPGHMVAMDRPDSTSGLVLPAAYLLDHGLKLTVKEAYDERLEEDETGISFSYDDNNTRELVKDGKVSAGATDDWHYAKWKKEAPGRYVMLGTTGSALRQVALLRPGLESGLQAAIKNALLDAPANPDGLAALQSASETCKFDDVSEIIAPAQAEMRAIRSRLEMIPGWPRALEEIH